MRTPKQIRNTTVDCNEAHRYVSRVAWIKNDSDNATGLTRLNQTSAARITSSPLPPLAALFQAGHLRRCLGRFLPGRRNFPLSPLDYCDHTLHLRGV